MFPREPIEKHMYLTRLLFMRARKHSAHTQGPSQSRYAAAASVCETTTRIAPSAPPSRRKNISCCDGVSYINASEPYIYGRGAIFGIRIPRAHRVAATVVSIINIRTVWRVSPVRKPTTREHFLSIHPL